MSPAPRALATGTRSAQLGRGDIAQDELHSCTCERSFSIAMPENISAYNGKYLSGIQTLQWQSGDGWIWGLNSIESKS